MTSARALVLRGEDVLVVREPDGGRHLLPGGRLEPGESIEDALRREVLEETGWALRDPRLIGFVHLRHLAPRPPGYERYPYPDFLHAVFAAEADEYRPDAMIADEWVASSEMRPIDEVRVAPDVIPGHIAYLEAAVKLLRGGARGSRRRGRARSR